MVVREPVNGEGIVQQDIRIKDVVLDVGPVAIDRIRGKQSSGLFNRFLEQSGLIFDDAHLVQQQPHRPVPQLDRGAWTAERAPVMMPSPPEIIRRTF